MSRNPIYIKLINTTKWRTIRAEKLRRDPLCENCVRLGKSALATEVHHIKPVESVAHEIGMRHLMYNENNLQSLCHSCHKEIHKAMRSQSKEAVAANNKRSTERFIDKYL